MKKELCITAILLLGVTMASRSEDLLEKYAHKYMALEEADVEAIIQLLDSHDSEVRGTAVTLVSVAFLKGFPSALPSIPKLIQLLKTDDDASVRARAADALFKSGDEKAVEPLLDVAGDESLSPIARGAALHALSRMGVRTEDVASIAVRNLDSPDCDFRFWAILAIGRSKAASKIGRLLLAYIDHYEHPNVLLKETSVPVHGTAYDKLSAAYSLSLRGIASSKPDMLVPLLKQPSPSIRSDVALALADAQDRRAVPTLVHILRHSDDPDLRYAAAAALGFTLQDKGAIRVLKDALRDEDGRVAEVACSALLNLGVKVEKVGEGREGPVEYRIIDE